MTDWSAYPIAQGGASTAAASPPDDPWSAYPTERRRQRSAGDEMLRQVGLGGRYLLEGLSAPIAIVGNAANGLANYGVRGINAVAGTNLPEFGTYQDYTQRALDKALPNPETPDERVIAEMSRFVAGTGGTAGMAKVGEMAGTKALAPLGQNLGTQAIAAEAAGGAYGLTGEHTDNALLKTGAALLGGGGGAGLATAVERAAPQTVTKIPTTQQIKDMSTSAMREVKDAGAIIGPQPLQRTNEAFTKWLSEDFGYDPALYPKIGVLMDRLNKAGEQNITAEGVNLIRKLAVGVTRDGNPSERAIAGELIGRLDDMMENLGPGDVVQGAADDAAAALSRHRSLWKTYRKSELIDDLVVKGEDQALSTNSGGNVQNAIRQKLRSILDNDKKRRLFTGDELEAIRKIVRGTATENALRTIGRLAPSSNAQLGPLLAQIGGMGGGGYALGGTTGAAIGAGVPVAGALAKEGATALTKGAVNRLSELVRSKAVPAGPRVPVSPPDPAVIAAQLLMQGTPPRLPNAYAEFLLRSGPAAVPASGNQDTGPRTQP